MDKAIVNAKDMAQITRLYIEITGEITSHSSDVLNDALATYPPHWMIQALNKAKDNNIHNWRYVEKILLEKQKQTQIDPEKYTEGRYSENVHTDGNEIMNTWNNRKQAQKTS